MATEEKEEEEVVAVVEEFGIRKHCPVTVIL